MLNAFLITFLRSLRNTRTRIHKNLFVAMVMQVLIRLMLYIDIAIYRRKPHGAQRGIGNTVRWDYFYSPRKREKATLFFRSSSRRFNIVIYFLHFTLFVSALIFRKVIMRAISVNPHLNRSLSMKDNPHFNRR